ncbi:DNA polymerase III subunit chi [Vibrio tritonius]|uniref:DNA polymerase III subunit chi n=1 Tax=Vibrio tritonius TaxID=1435069 RepID=UPI00315DD125
MAMATFYIVKDNSPQVHTAGLEQYVVFLCQHFANQGAKVYLQCQDKSHAEHFAELFWQVEPSVFIAHNLVGEGPKYGTHIEIGHVGAKPSYQRQLAINVADNQTTFAHNFAEVIDFVPCEENAKQRSRERYKRYRQAGYQLQTIEIQYP